MKKKKLGCLILVSVIAVLMVFGGLYFLLGKKGSNNENNEAQTVYSTKPELYYFYADYCSACRKFKPLIQKMAEEFSDKYDFKPINVMNPRNYEITREYNVHSIPGIFLVNPINNNKQKLDLLYNEEYFRSEMKKFYLQPIR